MRYWLLKSEPDVFSFADLTRVGREPWNGVRNYQARNFLREMSVGDLALFYHSNTKAPGVAGVARVIRAAYPDDLQFDGASPYFDPRSSRDEPRWSMVDVAPVRPLARLVTLDELRALPQLADFALVRRGNRLSVLPVTPAQMEAVLRAGGLSLEALVGEPV
ncbi:EVE domain-containing protein [Deinococcus pimensis]|uniref:EVE domain-containing protein n=1 Tax=Deinococcus pimensis TaxID=309888 RepID=UPI0004817CAE